MSELTGNGYLDGGLNQNTTPPATGGGDMLKSVYDTNNDGVVDDSERLGGEMPSYYATAAEVAAAQQTADGAQPLSEKNQANGYAGLGGDGKVPAILLPSYVDDVIESADFASLPPIGETGKIYVTLNDNQQYRWSGSAYIPITSSPGTTDAVPEGVMNLYFTVARVLASVLTGLSAAAGTFTASDTILTAFGKVKYHIDNFSSLVTTVLSSWFISSARTYYVNGTTGNDNNDGLSSGAAFATIQKVFTVLTGKIISNNITIEVAAGTYAEEVTVPPLVFSGDYRITVNGALTVAASGQSTGASSAYTESGGTVVPAKLTNTGAAYVVNAHQKKFLRITGGTGFNATKDELNWYVIRENTATQISIVGDWNAALNSTTTYQIVSGATIIDGGGTRLSNISFRGDRVTAKGVVFSNCIGFAAYAEGSKKNLLVGCSLSCNAAGSATVGVIGAGFRVLSSYCNGTGVPNNIAFFEAFSFGEYDEDFKTSTSFTNSNTGVKGCWIDYSTSNGVTISDSHTRLTGNYFSNHAVDAIEIGRKGSTSMYGNDLTGQNMNIVDPSYVKIHSGNKIANITGESGATIYKQNAGGWFTSIVTSIKVDARSTIYGTGFNASTVAGVVQEWNGRYSCRLTKATSQSVASGTAAVQVTLDTAAHDPSSMRSGNTVVIKRSGWYMITAQASWASSSTGDRRVIRIRKNSGFNIAIDSRSPLNGFNTVQTVSTLDYLNLNDVIDVTVTQNSGGNLNLEAVADYSAILSVVQV